MIKKYKCYPALLIIISVIFNSCYTDGSKLSGSWESILIENSSSLFAKSLPSSIRGEVLLTVKKDGKFTWINKKEKSDLSGNYNTAGNKIYFNIIGEAKPLEVEYRFDGDKLIITTDDGFTFTFIKTE